MDQEIKIVNKVTKEIKAYACPYVVRKLLKENKDLRIFKEF